MRLLGLCRKYSRFTLIVNWTIEETQKQKDNPKLEFDWHAIVTRENLYYPDDNQRLLDNEKRFQNEV